MLLSRPLDRRGWVALQASSYFDLEVVVMSIEEGAFGAELQGRRMPRIAPALMWPVRAFRDACWRHLAHLQFRP